MVYEFPYDQQISTETDQIAFGFMTRQENGVLYRLESSLQNKDFIEIRLVGSISLFCNGNLNKDNHCPNSSVGRQSTLSAGGPGLDPWLRYTKDNMKIHVVPSVL